MMNRASRFQRTADRFPRGAALVYVGLVVLLVAGTSSIVADILDRRADVAAAQETLDRLEGRRPTPGSLQATVTIVPSGSPLLEGPTVTVAGASLLQRIAGAVTKAGGNILSSQVELQGPQSRAGFVTVVTSCELDQLSLQALLYDLEAGMPFLFIEQLVVQAPVGSSTNTEGRMRLLLAASAQWQDPR